MVSSSDDALSAASLASVTANVSGYSMLIGLAGALTTLSSQASRNRSIVDEVTL